MDVIESLRTLRAAQPVAEAPDVWEWQFARRLHFMATTTADGAACLTTSSTDEHDPALSLAVLRFAREHGTAVTGADPVAVVPGFTCAGYDFDVVVAARPSIHRLNAAVSPELHQLTYAVYPAYRCEFSGTEDEAEAWIRWSRIVPLVQIRRGPKPVLKVWFELHPRGPRAFGEEGGYADLETLVGLIGDLQDGGFLEFENFVGATHRIDRTAGTFQLHSEEGTTEQLSSDTVASAISSIICPE